MKLISSRRITAEFRGERIMLNEKIVCKRCGDSYPDGWPHTCSESAGTDCWVCKLCGYAGEPELRMFGMEEYLECPKCNA